ncbi:ADP-ribose pyrophosphatase [Anaerosporomusa subterranea]|uniref:ADP-ribose pyrophosphatase n=2 Tax=Anaerosporomusa subterranea TaxID=1794912 RepID=A0A154BU04_ANASB|nr:ADP-ribose pyrophosphatase [Anaerosporomusa subterranea]
MEVPMQQINEKLIEKPISSERIYEGAIVNIRRDTVTLPNGKSATREVVEHPGAVAVVPVTDDGKVILVRQFRHPIGQLLLEIPAGKLDKGEHPDDCARRELEEETGFVASQLRRIASIFTTPGFTNEIIHIYLATGLTATAQHPDEDEFLAVEYYDRDQIKELLAAGELQDSKTALGLLLTESLR